MMLELHDKAYYIYRYTLPIKSRWALFIRGVYSPDIEGS